jgi:signal transduction histidine kinase
MTGPSGIASRLRAMSPLQQDAVVAALATVGMVIEVGTQLDTSRRPALTIVIVVLIGCTLVWRRRAPAAATAGGLIGLGLFVQLAEVRNWTVPLLVVSTEFFTVGTADYSRRRLAITSCVLLVGLYVVVAIDPQDSSISAAALLANTVAFGLLPIAAGRVLRNRRVLAARLQARTAQLARERDERMRGAAVEERTRIARELHDVVAHSVSVMVIQAQGAQRVAAVDPTAARCALEAIESSGREALQEMRSMVGVLRGSDGDLAASSPGLGELPALADRARSAGLAVELDVSAELPPLPVALDLIAYRVVQEALTNTIKHAGAAHATVSVRPTGRSLELVIADDGSGDALAGTTGAGQGLVGMRERLALYGGTLQTGRRPAGGFRVIAMLPLDVTAPSSAVTTAPENQTPRARSRLQMALASRWFDVALAAVIAAMAAANLLLAKASDGGVAVNLLFAGLFGGCVLWRRTNALLYATSTITVAAVCSAVATDVRTFPLSLAIVVLPPYALAVYEPVRRGLLGLAVLSAGIVAVNLLAHRALRPEDLVFPIAVIVGTWVVGRALHGGRVLARELERDNRRLAAEREHRAMLAVADERTRIARELNVVVANSVSEMVVEAELAQRLLNEDLDAATRAMAAIEQTGRGALVEMRRMLGVLRGPDDAQLEPQPGLGGLPSLVEDARQRGQLVELSIRGEPGPLPASVELAAYRIVEEALAKRRAQAGLRDVLQIVFEFRPHDLLVILNDPDARLTPATVAMRERVALCHGELTGPEGSAGCHQLRITLPTDYAAVFA